MSLPGEILVRLLPEPNSVALYHVMYGKTCILKLVSVPSDADIKEALRRHRLQATTQETSEQIRHGQFSEDP